MPASNDARRLPRHDLARLLARVRIGSGAVGIGADVYIPLLLAEDDGLDADLLEEGLAKGTTALREVDEGGEVGKVHVRHDGERLLLLIDGEQILGAKQNRVFNASFLVAPGSEAELPVSCVERGRWRYDSREFRASEVTLTGGARSRKLSRVTQSIIVGDGYDAHQSAVWDDVDDYIERSRIISVTAAMEDAVDSQRDDTKAKLKQLRPYPDQAGIAMVRSGRVALMDLFASAVLYRRAYKKVAGGMLADPSRGRPSERDPAAAVAKALRRVARMAPHESVAPGCGITLHDQSSKLVLGAVAQRGRVYHAVVGAR
jgi:hypothetical protein